MLYRARFSGLALRLPSERRNSILMSMSTRLQIVMKDEEIEQVRRSAEREGLTVSEWARRALRRAQRRQAVPTPVQKMKALDRALNCGHATGDIEEILASIEQGRGLR